MSPSFKKTGPKQWISMSLYDTLWHYSKFLKCWFDALWHFMRCFEYKHSSTPLTAKEEKAQPVRAKQKKKTAQAYLKAVFIFCYICRTADGLFPLWSIPTWGERLAPRGNPSKYLRYLPNQLPCTYVYIGWIIDNHGIIVVYSKIKLSPLLVVSF